MHPWLAATLASSTPNASSAALASCTLADGPSGRTSFRAHDPQDVPGALELAPGIHHHERFLTAAELELALERMPPAGGPAWGLCPQQPEFDPLRTCAHLELGTEPQLLVLAEKIAAAFDADVSELDRIPVMRTKPGAARIGKHLDKSVATHGGPPGGSAQQWHPGLTILVYLTSGTVAGSGLLEFPHIGVSFAPRPGDALAFTTANLDGSARPEAVHRVTPYSSSERADKLMLQIPLRHRAATEEAPHDIRYFAVPVHVSSSGNSEEEVAAAQSFGVSPGCKVIKNENGAENDKVGVGCTTESTAVSNADSKNENGAENDKVAENDAEKKKAVGADDGDGGDGEPEPAAEPIPMGGLQCTTAHQAWDPRDAEGSDPPLFRSLYLGAVHFSVCASPFSWFLSPKTKALLAHLAVSPPSMAVEHVVGYISSEAVPSFSCCLHTCCEQLSLTTRCFCNDVPSPR